MRYRTIIVATSLVTATTLGSANAAPQMLGLVATTEPAPLTCTDGVCEAEISAFCLQQERDMPPPGTAYAPVGQEDIVIVARTADGRVFRLRTAGLASLSAARAQFAVTLRVPESLKTSLGAESLAIEVGPLASAAPVPVAGDADPLNEGEVAAASGPLRALAGNIAVTGGYNGTAAIVSNRLINTFKASGGGREGLWELTFGEEARTGGRYAQSATDPGVRRAAKYYRICQTIRDANGFERCLENAHDGYMGWINVEYWNNVGGGS